MKRIILDYSGHYPAKQVEVSDEEYIRIVELNKKYHGELCGVFSQGTQEETTFVNEIADRPNAGELDVFTMYC